MESQEEDLPALLARKDGEIAVYAKQVKVYKDKWINLEKDLKKYQKQLQVMQEMWREQKQYAYLCVCCITSLLTIIVI